MATNFNNARLSFATGSSANLNSTVTIGIRARATNLTNAYTAVFGNRTNGVDNDTQYMFGLGDGSGLEARPRFYFYAGGGYTVWRSNNDVTDDVWYNYAISATFNAGGAGTFRFSRNGAADSGSWQVGSGSGQPASNANGVFVGAMGGSHPGQTEPFPGDLADACIWSVALTQAELDAFTKGAIPPLVRPQGLVFWADLVRPNRVRIGPAPTTDGTLTAANHPRVYQ